MSRGDWLGRVGFAVVAVGFLIVALAIGADS